MIIQVPLSGKIFRRSPAAPNRAALVSYHLAQINGASRYNGAIPAYYNQLVKIVQTAEAEGWPGEHLVGVVKGVVKASLFTLGESGVAENPPSEESLSRVPTARAAGDILYALGNRNKSPAEMASDMLEAVKDLPRIL